MVVAAARGEQFALVARALGFAILSPWCSAWPSTGPSPRRSAPSPHGGQVAAGDFEARTEVTGSDEPERSAPRSTHAEDRVSTLSRAQQENEQLNESVIGLLEAVSELGRKDLTVGSR